MLNTLEQQLVNDVLAAQQGQLPAFQRLIGRSEQLVSSVAMSVVRDLDAADDIAQQVFIYLWQHLQELREPGSFLPWVRQITRSRALNYLRDHKLNQRMASDEAETLLAEFVDPDANPEAWHGRAQQSALLSQFLDALPADSRDLVLLFYREEQNSQQVADLLGMTEANVRKKLQRIREGLKEQWLARYGQLIFSTGSSISLTSALWLGLASASPGAAAATSSSLSKAGAPSLLALVGGAALGVLMAFAAIFYGMAPAIRNASDEQQRAAIRRVRNRSLLGMVLLGVAWIFAYEATQSALAPVLVFGLINLLIAAQTWQVWHLTASQRAQLPLAKQHQQRWSCLIGLSLGLTAGWTGLLVGLVQAGRW